MAAERAPSIPAIVVTIAVEGGAVSEVRFEGVHELIRLAGDLSSREDLWREIRAAVNQALQEVLDELGKAGMQPQDDGEGGDDA